MKKSELKERIKELEKEVTRLNGVIEGMERQARIGRRTSYPDPQPIEPYKPHLDWWQNGIEIVSETKSASDVSDGWKYIIM